MLTLWYRESASQRQYFYYRDISFVSGLRQHYLRKLLCVYVFSFEDVCPLVLELLTEVENDVFMRDWDSVSLGIYTQEKKQNRVWERESLSFSGTHCCPLNTKRLVLWEHLENLLDPDVSFLIIVCNDTENSHTHPSCFTNMQVREKHPRCYRTSVENIVCKDT